MTATVTDNRTLWFIDNLARVALDGEATGGAFDLVEIEGREGDMPPLHVHSDHDEAFHVLEGRLTVHLPGREIELGPGDALLAPRGVPHVYRVESERAKWLAISTPARFADFVREESDEPVGEGWPETEVRQERLVEAIEILRLLWKGGYQSHRGRHFTVENARLYTLPKTPPPIMIAVGGLTVASGLDYVYRVSRLPQQAANPERT